MSASQFMFDDVTFLGCDKRVLIVHVTSPDTLLERADLHKFNSVGEFVSITGLVLLAILCELLVDP